MRAFIAGATGYTGRALVRELISRGTDTYAHIRPDSDSLDQMRRVFTDQGAKVDMTPWDYDAMKATMEQVDPDHVFFVIGTTKARMKDESDATYENIDYGLAKLLLDACIEADADPVFVYLSAQGAGPDANTAYYEARWKAEREVCRGELDYVIARPGFISGPDRDESRPMERIGSKLASATASVVGAFGAEGLRDKLQPRDAAEMAYQLAEAAYDESCHNRILESRQLWQLGRHEVEPTPKAGDGGERTEVR